MYRHAVALMVAALSSSFALHAQTLQTVPSMPLSQFQDSLGVNIHIEYTDGEYADPSGVLQALQYIGIRNVRDSIPNPAAWAQGATAHLDQLAAAGVRFDFLGNCTASFSTAMQQLDAVASQYAGSVLSVEGPNEINNYPCQGGSGSNQQQATQYQQQLYSYVHSDSLLKNVPVLYMTGAAPLNVAQMSGLADVANTHPYPYGGVQPFSRLEQDFSSYFPGITANTPKQITETGYFTVPTAQDGVDETAQAEMIGNIYFDAALEGNTRTFIYQLLDAYNDNTSDNNYGFFNYDHSPKTIAVALHALHDQLPWDKTSAPRAVQAELKGLPAGTGKALALTSSDGSIYLFMWNELPVWNEASHTRIDNPMAPVYVTIPGQWNISYFTPATDMTFNNIQPASDGSVGVPVQTYPTAIIFHPKH